MRLRRLVGSGRFWQWLWTAVAVQFLCHVPLVLWTTVGESLRYLNTISVLALVLSALAALQGSLTMRKADKTDPL